ncbi:thiol reductant ABC exporter subunit CydC [Halopseudomonas xiamenensis]|uniref:thiol reductant ABC exporter subunit CydC n=1 Tax=Halopseudomonas xiamenensis TaxID=157792 RepID=UPI001627DF97|nr:thiol reductant ABC exporter subunit CydC [Halopseudomonas xiamenensis]
MRELLPWLKLLDEQRRRLLLGALLMAFTLLSAVGLLGLSGWFITATGLTALAWAAGQRVMFDVYVPGGGIRFFALSRTLSRYAERVVNHDTVLRLLATLRSRHFAGLARLDAATLGRLRAAQWLNRLTADIDTLDSLYLRLLAPPVVALAGVLVVCALVGIFHLPLAAALAAALLVLLAGLTWGMGRWCQRLSAGQVGQLDELRLRSIEQLQGLAELRAAGTLGGHQQRLLASSEQMLDEQLTLQRRVALAQALTGLLLMASVLAALWMALQWQQAGLLSGPVAVMLALALLALGEGLTVLPAAFARFGATLAAARRLNEQVALGSRLAEPARPRDVPDRLDIHWQQVSVRHAGIAGLDLQLEAGTRLALIGRSGCGKSTLAALLARQLDPDAGEVRVAGVTLTELALADWHARIAYLTQQAALLHDSVAANLLLGKADASDAELWQVLEAVGLADLVESLPRGLDHWVGESGRQLSGGEGRRLALARVLLKGAPLVILDEPFSGLDQATRERVRQGIEPYLRGRTVLLLGHAPLLLPAADRVVYWRQLQ